MQVLLIFLNDSDDVVKWVTLPGNIIGILSAYAMERRAWIVSILLEAVERKNLINLQIGSTDHLSREEES